MDQRPEAHFIEMATPGAGEHRPAVAPPLPAPPAELATLLAGLTPARRRLYEVVREGLDELERAISWGLLYYPPDDLAILVERFEALAASIRRMPARLSACLPDFPAEEVEGLAAEPLRDEVEFYFESVLHMVEKDLARLEGLLDSREAGAAAGPGEIERLCELAADLKGKFASATMGATSALVAQGRWPSLEAEPVLFHEKAEEFARTRELAAALRGIVASLEELPRRVPLAEIVARWREGQRADQYAFADLVVLRGQLGSLLRERVRRALYSGDYHQIRQREVQLAERVSELEWLHRRIWSMPAPSAAELLGAELPRLEQLACEIAALIDVEQLKALLGEPAVMRLRKQVGSAGAGAEPLITLLAHDDLRLYFDVLHGAVQRRAALAGSDRLASAPTAPRPAAAVPPPPARREPAPPRQTLAPAQQATLVADLRRRLATLQSPQSSHFNDFRLVLRLYGRHGRVPDEMVRASLPFVDDLLTLVVPDLRRLAPYRGLTEELVERLDGTCRGLLADPEHLPPGETPPPQRLARLQRFLDALQSVLASA